MSAPAPRRFSGLPDLGRWVFLVALVLLGLAAGTAYVRLHSSRSQARPRSHYLDSPYQAMLFHRGQLHVQSSRAIGHGFPRDLSRAYQRAGYEWISITDVNTLTPVDQYTTPGMVVVPGTEAGFSFGHLLDFGVVEIPVTESLQQNIDYVHGQAGKSILARPRAMPAVSVEQAMRLKGLDGIEIYNARAALEQPPVADATDMWDQMLTRGYHLSGVFGDDTLLLDGPGSTLGATSVDVQAPVLDAADILDAVRRGAFVDSTGVRVLGVDTSAGDRVKVVTTDATTIDWIGGGGRVLATTTGSSGTYVVRWNEGYVRAVARRDGARALTQPIWVIP